MRIVGMMQDNRSNSALWRELREQRKLLYEETNMSLDIWCEIPSRVCIHCGHDQGQSGNSYNMTHNVVPMWEKAGCRDALYESEGKMVKDVLPDLERGLSAMEADPEGFKKLDSPNGWGIYWHALGFLQDVVRDFRAAPSDAVVKVSR